MRTLCWAGCLNGPCPRGTKLAKEGRTTLDIQVFLGHTNIQNTGIYTKFAPSGSGGSRRAEVL